jgi:hypothetical protein
MKWLVAAVSDACIARGLADISDPLDETTGVGTKVVPVSVALSDIAGEGGEAGALTVSMPDVLPSAVGLYSTVIVQLAPPASDAPQVLDCEKPGVTAIWSDVMGVAVVFCSVNGRGVLCPPTAVDPKSLLAGVSVTAPPGTVTATPVADKVSMTEPAFVFTVNGELCGPATVGLKVTVYVQDCPAAREVVQVVLITTNAELTVYPVSEMDCAFGFFTVITTGALTLSTSVGA